MSTPEQDKAPEHQADGIVENRETRPPVYFNILFIGLIVWGVIFMAYYLLSGWSSKEEFRQKMAIHQGQPAAPVATAGISPATTGPKAPPGNGQELFAANCSGCHGADAKGGYGPDLTQAELEYGKSPAALHESISAGRDNKMPAFGSKLSSTEIDALVSYLLQL